MLLRKLLYFLSAFLAAPLFMQAQSYRLRLHGVDLPEEKITAIIKPPANLTTQPGIVSFIQGIVPALQEKGFLAASVDSIQVQNEVYDCYVYAGQQYKWARVSYSSFPPALITAGAVNPAQWEGRPLSPAALSRSTEKILLWCENNGYPFARVWLDSIHVNTDGGVTGAIVIDKGNQMLLDSVTINGEVRISKNYLLRYLDLGEGKPYSELKLRNISARLRELPFLQEERPWNVSFRPEETKLNLYLKERPANQVNAIVGLLPNSQQTGKFLLTFDALFAFQNILGNGEALSLTVQKLQYRSVTVKADAVWPYLFNTPLGAEGHFDFYNKDSTFQRMTLQLGGRYQFSATDYLRIYYEHRNSHAGTVDTAFVRANKRLPDNVDVSANGGGTEFILNHTDYRLNPRKGWQVRIAGSVSLRDIRRNDQISSLTDGSGFNYNSLYDSLARNAYQYKLSGELAWFVPVARKATLKTSYAGGWISGSQLFQNELYQVGGFKLLRGFDEESIFTNQYHVLTLELRLLLSRTSNVYLFSDNGWVQSRFNGSNTEGLYNGFGVGTTLETKNGVFTISYALGRSDANPIQLRQSKVHFGYVAFF